MKGVERTNIVMAWNLVQGQQTEFVPKQDSYAIEIDQDINFYNYRRFRHLARHYRN